MVFSRFFSSKSSKLPKRRGELLYGLASCLAALQMSRRKVYSIILQDGFGRTSIDRKHNLKQLVYDKVNTFIRSHDTQLCTVNKRTLIQLIGNKKLHQGILMDVEPLHFKPTDGNKLFQKYYRDPATLPLWLVLYQVQDPMNFGAILRCAYFLGVDNIFVTSQNSCCLSPVVSKASAGAMEFITVYSISDLSSMLMQAMNLGWEILGADSPQTISNFDHSKSHSISVISCQDHQIKRPTILVVGNEGCGLPQDILNCCTSLLTIHPLRGLPLGFDSLNVSVATGILLHNLQINKLENFKQTTIS